jgi:DNA-binding MarR family transcriptional regulator
MESSLGMVISDVARLLRRDFNARARMTGITNPQWRVLSALVRMEGINQGGLADFLEVEPITVARMIDRMQSAELVLRKSDPSDRRIWRLYLTPKAKDLIETLRPIALSLMEDALDGMATVERDTLQTLLEHMRNNLSKHTNGLQYEPSCKLETVEKLTLETIRLTGIDACQFPLC